MNLFFEIKSSTRLTFLIFLVPSFCFHDNSIARAHCSCLFFYQLLFFFWKCSFHTHYLRRVQNKNFPFCKFSQISEYEFCENYVLLFIFLQKRSYKASQWIIQRSTKSTPKFKWYWDKAPARKPTEDKMFYTLSQQITKPIGKLTLLASEWVFQTFYCLNYLV